MKKLILMFVIFLTIVPQLFAYKYWNAYKTTPSGMHTVHCKLCVSDRRSKVVDENYLKKLVNDLAENLWEKTPFSGMRTDVSDRNITWVMFDDGSFFIISFSFVLTSGCGAILVCNSDAELIYVKDGYGFNTLRAEYDQLCNNYLRMLD